MTGFSIEQYLRNLIDGHPMKSFPKNEVSEIKRQLAAIGNNINQIAKIANTYDRVRQSDVDYIDEIYLFFAGSSMGGAGDNVSKYSAEFLYKCWKRFRKYYATLTGITQNVEECLRSDTARMMFANSEFLLMFNQAPNDREVLAHILNASSAQMSYVSDKPPGHGLIKVGGAIVPLVNEFPKDTSLYWLMTTKPGEG